MKKNLEMEKTRALLKKTLVALEAHIDGDGQTG
jgi:hypothetical protein